MRATPNRVTMDGKLNYRRWDEEPPVWSYDGPFADHQEQMLQQALAPMFMTHEEIGEYVSAPLPQVELFRPRYGYPDVQDRQLTVADIVGGVSRIIPARATWYSGGPAGYTGAPRYATNTLGLV